MDREALKSDLIRDEGVVLYAYEDHLGYQTIGCGRLIDRRRGGGITMDEAMHLLGNDIERVEAELDRRISWWRGLSASRQRALANMAFQLGVNGLLGFRKMLAALRAGDYEKAASEALDSAWAAQTPQRAERVVKLLKG